MRHETMTMVSSGVTLERPRAWWRRALWHALVAGLKLVAKRRIEHEKKTVTVTLPAKGNNLLPWEKKFWLWN